MLYYLFALCVQHYDPFWQSQNNGTPFFYSVFKQNDAGWYEKIAMNGYTVIEHKESLKGWMSEKHQQSEWAFFPVYPMLIKGCMYILSLDFNITAFIITLILSTGSFILFYKYAGMHYKEDKTAFLATIFFILFPFNYYYSMMYTEAPFFILMMLSLFTIIKNKNYWLLLLLPLLTLLRPNGIVVAFTLYLFYFQQHIEKNNIGYLQPHKWLNKQFIIGSIPFLAAPLALIAYCFVQFHMTGDYFAFETAQAGWYKKNMFPLLALFRRGDMANQVNSIYTCIIMAIAVWNIKKIKWSYSVLIWLTILLPLSKGSVISMPRYISILFPIMLLLYNYVKAMRYKAMIFAASLVLQLCMFYYWLHQTNFSY